jgi:flagellar basal-body rod protein FlgC
LKLRLAITGAQLITYDPNATGIDSTASALAAERLRMEVITQNIANANTVRGIDGKPYQRQHCNF